MGDGTGWAMPSGGTRTHFFREGRSLCNRWIYSGDVIEHEEHPGLLPLDCLGCWHKRHRERTTTKAIGLHRVHGWEEK